MRSLIDETRPWKFPPLEHDIAAEQDSLPKYIRFDDMNEREQRTWLRQKRNEIRPRRTWKQWLMPWTYPKLTSEQRWALKQFD
ncbi:MAG: hypothetical protein IPN53_12305 [Comamonadaceae bacterium]|nr:hypothetical protein [Comamonadaceae bacterium]